MKLFTPVWKNNSYNSISKSVDAVSKITDMGKLVQIIKETPHYEVRRAAVEKITDQTVLADLAKNDLHQEIRGLAVEKLTDCDVLAEIAAKDDSKSVRMYAVSKLNEQSVLAELIEKNNDEQICLLIVGKLFEQNALAKIAETNENWKICFEAAKKLKDKELAQKVYAKIVRYDISPSNRKKVVRMLTDEDALAYVAKLPNTLLSTKLSASREIALGKIYDTSLLVDIAENAKDNDIRKLVSLRLSFSAV